MFAINSTQRKAFRVLLLICAVLLAGCARTSPMHEVASTNDADGKSAQEVFELTFNRHGGQHLSRLNDVNVAIDGEWHYLITKIQPLVTDDQYRQRSQERVLISPPTYAANYVGDAGKKQVLKTKDAVFVAYNSKGVEDEKKRSATALTADAFYLFVLGPLALSERVKQWQRLEDGNWEGKSYYRINGEITPGFGYSDKDFITVWVDKQTHLTFRVHITLEGFETTIGAHVDTSFLNYTTIDHFTFATHFFERVVGPISIDAHEWWYTGIDINRGLGVEDLSISGWSDEALIPASQYIKP